MNVVNIVKPNLFVVGAAKSGTTSLYNYIKDHPEVYLSPIKEPNYFNTELKLKDCRPEIKKSIYLHFDEYFDRETLKEKHFACFDRKKDYLKLYRDVKEEKIIGEFSTSYLHSSKAAEEIYNFNADSKIIIMLREPVSRTLSHYQMDLNLGFNTNNILEDLKNDFNSTKKGYCISNMYIDLSLYLDVFPKEQILFIKFEDLVKNNDTVLEKVYSFLGLNNDQGINTLNNIHNQTVVPKFKFLVKVMKFKKIIPRSILMCLKKIKPIFFKKPSKEEISTEIIEYLQNIVLEDFKKTNELIENHYGNENN